MTYAITGASGQLGRLTARALLQRVDPSEVVLLTRSPAQLDEFAARGVTVRPADFADPESLKPAFDGVDRLLLISTADLGVRLGQQRDAIDAAAASGVGFVAYTSVPHPTAENVALVVPDHAGTEDHLRASGMRSTMLRNNMYAEIQLEVVRRAAQDGRLVTNAGAGRMAPVTRADCAAVAAAVLAATGSTDAALDVTGPESLDSGDFAALASRLAGRPVEVVDLDDAAYRAGLLAAGLPDEIADVATSFGAATRDGMLADATTVVRDLTGTDPTALRALV